MIQNIAGGNTMIFNHAVRRLLCQVPMGIKIVSHDWLVYLLTAGCGGAGFL